MRDTTPKTMSAPIAARRRRWATILRICGCRGEQRQGGRIFPPVRAPPLLLALLAGAAACQPAEAGRGATVLFASGADLQGANPLITVHPLAKLVQKYVLLTTLVRYDSALRVEPYLARRWDWSDDRRRLTLHLATDVRWHDGAMTTARDVVWTIATAMNPGAGYARQSEMAEWEAPLAVDDSTVVLSFRRPPPTMPDVLTDLAILPARAFDGAPVTELRQAQWNRSPVGNGPFRFVAHEPNRRWVFAANDDFSPSLGGPPRLRRFIVVVVDEPTTKLAALTSGELDFAGISPAHASFVRRDRRLEVVDYPLFFTYGMVLNTRRPPFDDLAVRRAVSLALDRQAIIDGYLFGFGSAAGSAVPPGIPGRVPIPPVPPDRDAARALLGGAAPSFEILTVGSGEAPLEQMIQAQLREIGVSATIRQLELSAFLDRVYGPRHDFTAAVMGIPGDLGLGFLGSLATLTGLPDAGDPAATQRLLHDSAGVAFLYHARGVQGRNRRVTGVRMDLRGELPTVAQWDVIGEDAP